MYPDKEYHQVTTMKDFAQIEHLFKISDEVLVEQKEVAEKRLEICMDCEEWAKDAIVQHCKACGCATKIKVFTPVGSGACPRGKWVVWWKKVGNLSKYI